VRIKECAAWLFSGKGFRNYSVSPGSAWAHFFCFRKRLFTRKLTVQDQYQSFGLEQPAPFFHKPYYGPKYTKFFYLNSPLSRKLSSYFLTLLIDRSSLSLRAQRSNLTMNRMLRQEIASLRSHVWTRPRKSRGNGPMEEIGYLHVFGFLAQTRALMESALALLNNDTAFSAFASNRF
jgi:hypothetical protein